MMIKMAPTSEIAQFPNRQRMLQIGSSTIDLPVFFPSISSVKTQLSPLAYFQVINAVFSGKQFLISAYDLIRTGNDAVEQFVVEREKSRVDHTLVLMDSGNYEAYWHSSQKTWAMAEYHEALNWFKPDIAFGFDHQEPPEKASDHLKLLLTQLVTDQAAAGSTPIIPIIHGQPSELPDLAVQFAKLGKLTAIAIPERCLGASVFERVDALKRIRQQLDDLGRYVFLHLLGTGNPLSMALFFEAGADSFDGLEWCQTAVDYKTKQLHHFSHGALFLEQGSWGESSGSYAVRTLAHNLDFYSEWNAQIRRCNVDTSVQALIRESFPLYTYQSCERAGLWAL